MDRLGQTLVFPSLGASPEYEEKSLGEEIRSSIWMFVIVQVCGGSNRRFGFFYFLNALVVTIASNSKIDDRLQVLLLASLKWTSTLKAVKSKKPHGVKRHVAKLYEGRFDGLEQQAPAFKMLGKEPGEVVARVHVSLAGGGEGVIYAMVLQRLSSVGVGDEGHSPVTVDHTLHSSWVDAWRVPVDNLVSEEVPNAIAVKMQPAEGRVRCEEDSVQELLDQVLLHCLSSSQLCESA